VRRPARTRARPSRILSGMTSGACDLAAGIVRLPAQAVARLLGPGGHVGRVARHVYDEGHGAASMERFGHGFAIVCLRGLQSRGKCGNPRENGDSRRTRDVAANRAHSPVEDARLKIVVSPVRVRVSPLPETCKSAGVGLFGGPRKQIHSGTRTVTPHDDDRMVVALVRTCSAQCCLCYATFKPLMRGLGPSALRWGRVPGTSSQ